VGSAFGVSADGEIGIEVSKTENDLDFKNFGLITLLSSLMLLLASWFEISISL